MYKRLKQARGNQSGVTLTELPIVTVILVVLGGVGALTIGSMTDRGKSAACSMAVRTVQTSGAAYYFQNGSYAGTMDALVTAGFMRGPAPAPTDIKYTVNADTTPTLAVVKGTTGVCAP